VLILNITTIIQIGTQSLASSMRLTPSGPPLAVQFHSR
jgi:hypothetical protein